MSEPAKPSQANIDKMWAYARKFAEKSGTSLHPDVTVTESRAGTSECVRSPAAPNAASNTWFCT